MYLYVYIDLYNNCNNIIRNEKNGIHFCWIFTSAIRAWQQSIKTIKNRLSFQERKKCRYKKYSSIEAQKDFSFIKSLLNIYKEL